MIYEYLKDKEIMNKIQGQELNQEKIISSIKNDISARNLQQIQIMTHLQNVDNVGPSQQVSQGKDQ